LTRYYCLRSFCGDPCGVNEVPVIPDISLGSVGVDIDEDLSLPDAPIPNDPDPPDDPNVLAEEEKSASFCLNNSTSSGFPISPCSLIKYRNNMKKQKKLLLRLLR